MELLVVFVALVSGRYVLWFCSIPIPVRWAMISVNCWQLSFDVYPKMPPGMSATFLWLYRRRSIVDHERLRRAQKWIMLVLLSISRTYSG